MVNQYWNHTSSGETYAVQFNIGHVISACGPLPYTEVTAANLDQWNFNDAPEDATWIDESQDDFKIVEAPYSGDK
jgi:hypothetical protein